MPLSSDLLRGHTDLIILTQLIEKDSYGYEINKNIRERTNGEYGFNEATLYTAFKRLEKSGFIVSYWGDEGSGARRRYYSITEAGRRYRKEKFNEWTATRALLDSIISLEVDINE